MHSGESSKCTKCKELIVFVRHSYDLRKKLAVESWRCGCGVRPPKVYADWPGRVLEYHAGLAALPLKVAKADAERVFHHP